jgi:small subunit ribosomal protein S17
MKKLVGTVISDKMTGSAVVLVESAWRHPLYKKTVKRSKKYLVDNEKGAKTGAKVELTEGKPSSRRKRFNITKILG